MDPERNDAAASSIREYLAVLLGTLWEEKSQFNGKRPFGSSSWYFELFTAMVEAGVIAGKLDEDGYLAEVDNGEGDRLIAAAIEEMCGVSTPVDE